MNLERIKRSEQAETEENAKYPLISIIVPVYNAARYLEKCVYSLLNQTYTNFELLLINDGSQDNSFDLCCKFEKEDHRIHVHTQHNGGASSARNKGLQLVQGKYIVFVDSDDSVSETYIENLYLAAIFGNFDIVQCQLTTTSQIKKKIPSIPFNTSDVMEITKAKALNGRMYKVSIWGKIYAAHVFDDFRFQEGIIYEDDASYYQLVDRAEKIAVLNEILYCYYLSENSVMRNSDKNFSTEFVGIYEDRIRYFLKKNDECLLDGSRSRFCLVLLCKISKALVKGSNADDINWLLTLFRQNYLKVKKSKYVSRRDKFIFQCFHISPEYIGWLIGWFLTRPK